MSTSTSDQTDDLMKLRFTCFEAGYRLLDLFEDKKASPDGYLGTRYIYWIEVVSHHKKHRVYKVRLTIEHVKRGEETSWSPVGVLLRTALLRDDWSGLSAHIRAIFVNQSGVACPLTSDRTDDYVLSTLQPSPVSDLVKTIDQLCAAADIVWDFIDSILDYANQHVPI